MAVYYIANSTQQPTGTPSPTSAAIFSQTPQSMVALTLIIIVIIVIIVIIIKQQQPGSNYEAFPVQHFFVSIFRREVKGLSDHRPATQTPS